MYEAVMLDMEKRLELRENGTVLVGVDGPCATGKTTFSMELAKTFSGKVVHIDDFFLPFDQRGKKEELASNINKPSILEQVLRPLSQHKTTTFQPYSCKKGAYESEVRLTPEGLVIVEGVYSLLPEFRDFFHVKIYLKAQWQVRKERLLSRGSSLEQFEAEWIPRENLYFEQCQVEEACDFVIET